MKPFIEYLSDSITKTKKDLERETGLTDRLIRKSISHIKLEQPVFYSNNHKGYRLAKDPDTLEPEEVEHERNCALCCLRDIGSRKAVFTVQETVYLEYIKRCDEILDNKKSPLQTP